ICQRNGTKVYNNDITSGGMGITISFNCTNNEIYGNTVSGGLPALFLLQNNPGTFANNMIYQNSFTATGCLIYLGLNPAFDVHDNFVFNNNFSGEFIKKLQDIVSPSSGGIQFWYCYPTCGNYWTSHSGTDAHKGPNQDTPGGDGIGDSPFMLDFVGIWFDNYPRMEPWNGTKVNWDTGAPSLSGEYPPDSSTGVSVNEPIVNVTIVDPCDCIDWSIEGDYINDASGTNSPCGNKWATSITPLPDNVIITWYVNVTDGFNASHVVYSFTTEGMIPVVDADGNDDMIVTARGEYLFI
ncbi:unnamed protein product, partial [marine sediment metagenome]